MCPFLGTSKEWEIDRALHTGLGTRYILVSLKPRRRKTIFLPKETAHMVRSVKALLDPLSLGLYPDGLVLPGDVLVHKQPMH